MNRIVLEIDKCCRCYNYHFLDDIFYCRKNGKQLWRVSSQEEDSSLIPDWCPILKQKGKNNETIKP